MFKDAGWHTLSFGKTFDLRTSSFNLSQEWICDGIYSWSEPAMYCDASTWASDLKLAGGQSHAVIPDEAEAHTADAIITAAAVAQLGNASLPSPWLVAVGLHRPHLPLIVPQRFVDLYPPGSVGLPTTQFAPSGMPNASTECSGTYASDPSGGCEAGHGSFELWQQYSYNSSAAAEKKWDGWTGEVCVLAPIV